MLESRANSLLSQSIKFKELNLNLQKFNLNNAKMTMPADELGFPSFVVTMAYLATCGVNAHAADTNRILARQVLGNSDSLHAVISRINRKTAALEAIFCNQIRPSERAKLPSNDAVSLDRILKSAAGRADRGFGTCGFPSHRRTNTYSPTPKPPLLCVHERRHLYDQSPTRIIRAPQKRKNSKRHQR